MNKFTNFLYSLFVRRPLWLAFVLIGCTTNTDTASTPQVRQNYGVVLMAHGGTPEWNEAVSLAVEPLRTDTKIEIAFGMADAYSIQEAVENLEAQGVQDIGVVRLFVSGESWYGRTEKILGLREGAPNRNALKHEGLAHGTMDHSMHGGAKTNMPHSAEQMKEMPAMPGGHRMEYWKLETNANFALSQQGLSESSAMDAILAERALALSKDPAAEDVLILAHGPGDDEENQRWIDNITARSALVATSAPFRRVTVMTLREDWHDKRQVAEDDIRAYVKRADDEGGVAIVIPFRTHGFGPYGDVLEGLDYRSDGMGLIPHKNVTLWIKEQSDLLRAGDFQPAQ